MLRDYQNEIAGKACSLLQQYKIAYLSMQVRTGKTLTALAAAQNYGAKSVLFLTKKKAIQSVLDDYAKLSPSFRLTCTNYEDAHNVTGEYDLWILDEAHCLGQFPKPAKRTITLKLLCKGLPIIYLSGSPTPESFSQIFHQFFVSEYSPFQDKNFYKWATQYVNIKKKYLHGMSINDYSDGNKEKIDAVCKHLFLSFTQNEAGFEQEVIEKVLHVKMHPFTYSAIETLKRDRIFTSNKGIQILADTEVKLMGKLHQMFSGSVIDENGDRIGFDDSKVKFIKEKFKGKKIAIFYKYQGEESLLRKHFPNITLSPEEFNSSTDQVFISQIQSGREGVNLSTADCIVMMNIDYSAVSYLQAKARLQTKDRVKPALVYWIFATSGIEEKIYQRVINKMDFTLSHFRKEYDNILIKTIEGVSSALRKMENKKSA